MDSLRSKRFRGFSAPSLFFRFFGGAKIGARATLCRGNWSQYKALSQSVFKLLRKKAAPLVVFFISLKKLT